MTSIESLNKLNDIVRRALASALGKNVLSLYVLQIANYILPLVTVPYLVRVLGPQKFGLVAFGQSLMRYIALVVNYGFDWSATREIAVRRGDFGAVSRIAARVWAAKAMLCAIGLIATVISVQMVPRLADARILLFALYGIVIGNMLFPTWLFQGLEQMVKITLINLVARLLLTLGVFGLVHQPSDVVVYAGLLSFQWVTAGVLGVFIAFRSFQISFVWPGLGEILQTLSDGWSLFLSTGAISLYTAGNAFILGLMANDSVVGYYSAAERLVKSVQNLTGPISQAVYPRVSKLAEDSRFHALKWGRQVFFLMGGLGMSLTLILFMGAPLLVRVVLGNGYSLSTSVMRILAPLPLLVAVSNVLGIQIMLPFGHDRSFTFIVVGAAVINVFLAFLLVPLWQQNGMAVAVLAAEAFVTLATLIYLSRNRLNPLQPLERNDA